MDRRQFLKRSIMSVGLIALGQKIIATEEMPINKRNNNYDKVMSGSYIGDGTGDRFVPYDSGFQPDFVMIRTE